MAMLEERTYPRYPCLGEAKLNYVGRTTEIWAKILNVSLGGCLLSLPTTSTLVTGDDLELMIRIKGISFQVRGCVVPGASHQQRVGVLFASMTSQNRMLLTKVLLLLADDLTEEEIRSGDGVGV